MSYLAGLKTGTSPSGMRAVIYAVEKMGKTTLTSDAPGAIIVPTEVGVESASLLAQKGDMVVSWDQLMGIQQELMQAGSAGHLVGKTIVYDSATAIERLIHNKIVGNENGTAGKKAPTMESAMGGYGAAYTYANQLFASFLQTLDYLAVTCRANVLFTAHAFASRAIDPMQGEYDTWDILLHSPKNNKTYGKRELLTQWADLVGFLHEPFYVNKDADSAIASSAGKGIVLAVARTPQYVAGNRYGVVNPIPIPLKDGWNHLAHAIYHASGKDFYRR